MNNNLNKLYGIKMNRFENKQKKKKKKMVPTYDVLSSLFCE